MYQLPIFAEYFGTSSQRSSRRANGGADLGKKEGDPGAIGVTNLCFHVFVGC